MSQAGSLTGSQQPIFYCRPTNPANLWMPTPCTPASCGLATVLWLLAVTLSVLLLISPLAETDTARPRMDMQLALMHLAVVPAALQ